MIISTNYDHVAAKRDRAWFNPPKTSSERTIAMRERRRAEGKIEVRGVFLGPKGRERIDRLAERWGITRSEAIGRALRIAEENDEAVSG